MIINKILLMVFASKSNIINSLVNLYTMKKHIIVTFFIISSILFYSSCQSKEKPIKTNDVSIFDKTDTYVEKMMDSLDIIGLNYAILIDGKVVHKGTKGLANIEHNVPMKPDHLFAVASLSKLFSSTALHSLLISNNRNVNETVGDFLPNRFDLPESWRALTLKHLLSHTSGIPDQIDYDIFLAPESESFVIDALKDKPFSSEPDETNKYNATGFMLVCTVIEALANQDFETYMKRNYFDKYGLSKANYGGFKKVVPNRVTSYRMVENNLELFPLNYSSPMYAGAGLNINIDELILWMQAVLNYEILPKPYLDNVWEPVKLNSGDTGYFGLGWEAYKFDDKIAINGHAGGGIVSLLHYRTADYPNGLTIILLTNGAKNWVQMPHDVNMGIASYFIPEILDFD